MNGPIDPLDGPKLALSGQIVTMDSSARVLKNGVIFIEHGTIVAVRNTGEAPPQGFEAVKVLETGGAIFPGLIELHNHLSYNILPLWDVPKKFGNRGNWAGTVEYQTLISKPMSIIGQTSGVLPAVTRYTECKCLLAGVTTTQGIELFSNAGVRRFYRGIVRNVEQTDDPNLPEAATRIADIDAADAGSFLTRLKQKKCFLLHLAEGLDQTARNHFLSLQFKPGQWAITPSLAGIHCAGLESSDFHIMAQKGASMIWSPFSNLLLYGGTAQIKSAKQAGVRIGIGSDWSPSGSKNLLGELKVAHLVSQEAGAVLSDRELVALATVNAAAILGWQDRLGSIEAGKYADFLVLSGASQDPYGALIRAGETAIRLVMINGVPRYGMPSLMKSLGSHGERLIVGGEQRMLNLAQQTADPDLGSISLAQARTTLAETLKNLPHLKLSASAEPQKWFLALDELDHTGMDLRPHFPLNGHPTMAAAKGNDFAATPISVPSITLDPLTVGDDSAFLDLIPRQRNLPDFIKQNLASLY